MEEKEVEDSEKLGSLLEWQQEVKEADSEEDSEVEKEKEKEEDLEAE